MRSLAAAKLNHHVSGFFWESEYSDVMKTLWEKVMRTLKRPDTPILTGYQIYHNYIRPHEALNGKTPSEVVGIKISGRDKWLTIIQNESQNSGKKTSE